MPIANQLIRSVVARFDRTDIIDSASAGSVRLNRSGRPGSDTGELLWACHAVQDGADNTWMIVEYVGADVVGFGASGNSGDRIPI